MKKAISILVFIPRKRGISREEGITLNLESVAGFGVRHSLLLWSSS